MEDSNSVMPSGAYGIPKWIMKKGMRYEVDDFIVSPPSLDDGGFLRLRYGRTNTHASSLQGPGQDGGMTVEVKDDTLQFSSDITSTTTTTTIAIGPGGLSVESTPTATPLTTPETKAEGPEVHPLLVLPMNFGGEPKFVVKVDSSKSSKTNTESLGSTASAASKEASREGSIKSLDSPETHNTSTLVDRVRSLSVVTSPNVSVGSSSPVTPVTSPFTTPRTSPTLHRKTLVAMDPPRKISAHSYFCTKKYKDPQGDLTATSSVKQDVMPSVQTQQINESSIPPHALDPKMMGQRRRQPKPSTLREMNFWAPTSM